jgi:hypothetical protein
MPISRGVSSDNEAYSFCIVNRVLPDARLSVLTHVHLHSPKSRLPLHHRATQQPSRHISPHQRNTDPSLLSQDKAAAALVAFVSASPEGYIWPTGVGGGVCYPEFSKANPIHAATIRAEGGLKRFVIARPELSWQLHASTGATRVGLAHSRPQQQAEAQPPPPPPASASADPQQRAPPPCTFEYVQDSRQAYAAMQRVRHALDQERKRGAGDPMMAVDIEGDLNEDGHLSLIQIKVHGLPPMVFDVLSNPDVVFVSGLVAVLENPAVVKVMHDCRKDAVALFGQLGVRLTSVYDTQVGLHPFSTALCLPCFCMPWRNFTR